MKLDVEYTRRTAYADVREPGSVSILCTSVADGLAYFYAHYPSAQGYELKSAATAE